jgi:hypothetical protein
MRAFVITWWYDYEESEVIAVFSTKSAAEGYLNAHAANAGEESKNYSISEHEIDSQPPLKGISRSDRQWGQHPLER